LHQETNSFTSLVLIKKTQTPYLIALRNISQIKILSIKAEDPPEDFKLKDFAESSLNFFDADDFIDELIIELPESVRSYIEKNELHAKTIELSVDNTAPGHFKLIATQVNNNQRLHQWLLGFKDKAHVIAPFELRKIINQADIDKLTNLYNRTVFERLLYREIDWCHRDESHHFSLLILDIDKFKTINDTYGHVFGDEVLKEVANCLRDYDGIRYGGEEFIVFLPQTQAQNAFNIAERIRLKLEALKLSNNQTQVNITISIGIAEFPIHLPTNSLAEFNNKKNIPLTDEMRTGLLEKITKQADLALYQAKENGRNQCIIASKT